MDRVNALWDTVGAIAELLRNLGIPFQLTGGIAASYYGEPRMTQDVDIVIALDAEMDIVAFCQQFPDRFPVDEDFVREALREGSLFQILDQETFIKIDLHIGEIVPGEMARSRPVAIAPGLTVPMISKEGAILSKLNWFRLGSSKSRRDAVMMLLGEEETDRDYLERQAAALGLRDLLVEVDALARGISATR